MKKIFFIIALILSIFTFSFGQIEKKMKDENVVAGSIIKDGKEIVGYIKRMDYEYFGGKKYPSPWSFQSEIKFIPKDIFENTKKIKNKLYKKYTPKDCDGYKYDTLIYESVKYADLTAVGTNMIPKKIFMRKVVDNKISIFHYFKTPPSVMVSQGDNNSIDKTLTDCATIQYVYRIGKDGKLKLVEDLNIEKELADCPMVVQKQQKGEYKVIGKEGSSSGLNKFINNIAYRVDVRLMAIADYNQNCK